MKSNYDDLFRVHSEVLAENKKKTQEIVALHSQVQSLEERIKFLEAKMCVTASDK